MGKSVKLLGVMAAAAALSGAAAAQVSNGTLAQGGLLHTVGANDVAAMMAEFSITSQLQNNQAGGAPILVATTSSGAKFLVGFYDCASPAEASGCKQTTVSTALPSTGATYDDVNAFNGAAAVTTVVYDNASQILIFGRNIYTPGGVARDNYKLQVALFLRDMQTFVESQRGGGATSVSFRPAPNLKSKIDSFVAGDAPQADLRRVAVSRDLGAEKEIAISNMVGMDFAVEFDLAD